MTPRADAAAKPAETGIPYDGITLDQLVAVYKQAYVDAGFEFRELSTRKAEGPGRPEKAELVFEFTNPNAPHKNKATRTFRIDAFISSSGTCAPCTVFGGAFPGYLGDHDPEEYNTFIGILTEALGVAGDQVIRKLGKGFAAR